MSFNADNDEEDDVDDGYHDDDFHIMVKRNGWGISLSQKTARNIRHCEFQLPSHLYKISQKIEVINKLKITKRRILCETTMESLTQ